MSESLEPVHATDPLSILGLSRGATEQEIRARYLELVKRFPPEHEPERFRKIHAAFQAARDPLVLAKQMLAAPDDSPPSWSDVIGAQKLNPPAWTVDFLLSLGNRDEHHTDESHTQDNE